MESLCSGFGLLVWCPLGAKKRSQYRCESKTMVPMMPSATSLLLGLRLETHPASLVVQPPASCIEWVPFEPTVDDSRALASVWSEPLHTRKDPRWIRILLDDLDSWGRVLFS